MRYILAGLCFAACVGAVLLRWNVTAGLLAMAGVFCLPSDKIR